MTDKRGLRKENLYWPRYRFAYQLLPGPSVYGNLLVDIGCGRAEFARLAREKGYKIICLDGDRHNVTRTIELGFEAYCVDLEKPLPFPDNAFSGAVLLDVIEHIVQAEMLAKEIARVVQNGGFLLASTPNFAFIKYRLRHLFGHPPPNEGYHYRFFTKRSFESLLRDSGFDIVSGNSFGMAHGINRVRRMLGRDLIWINYPEFLDPLFAHTFVVLAKNR